MLRNIQLVRGRLIDKDYPMLVDILVKPEFKTDEYEYINQEHHHDRSLVECLAMAIQGKFQRDSEEHNLLQRERSLRYDLAIFTEVNRDVCYLSYHGDVNQRLMLDMLAEVTINYKRHLGKWPLFMEDPKELMDRERWFGWYFLDEFANRPTPNNEYNFAWCNTTMFNQVIEFYIHIILRRENVEQTVDNAFSYDDLCLAYICANRYDIGIHIWKQIQTKSNITYEHYDFIHRNTRQDTEGMCPTINVLWIEPQQKLGTKTVMTCPQFRLLLHNGSLSEDVDPTHYNMSPAPVPRYEAPPLPFYRTWLFKNKSIADLYNCMRDEFNNRPLAFDSLERKCMRHFCQLDNKDMSYFNKYEHQWKTIHAIKEYFPVIGLYGMHGIPDIDI
jgi:hypothetical protein